MKTELIPLKSITVPSFCERPEDAAADARDKASIRQRGIRQPLIVVPDGERLLLADGLRRIRFARELKIELIPVVRHPALDGFKPRDYARHLRLGLDVMRQDLRPSQLPEMVELCKARLSLSPQQIADLKHKPVSDLTAQEIRDYTMTYRKLAELFGVTDDTITAWRAIESYIPPVKAALDSELLSQKAARVFDGMTERGQKAVWTKHAEEIAGSGKADVYKRIRRLYPPATNKAFYAAPSAEKGRHRKRGKGVAPAPKRTESEAQRRRLQASTEHAEHQLSVGLPEEKRLKGEIAASVPVVSAILRSEKLRQLVPKETLPELERFAECYC